MESSYCISHAPAKTCRMPWAQACNLCSAMLTVDEVRAVPLFSKLATLQLSRRLAGTMN